MKYLFYIIIYIIMCTIWGIFSGYKQRTIYNIPLNCWKNVIVAGLVNFLVFPYALYKAFKHKKF